MIVLLDGHGDHPISHAQFQKGRSSISTEYNNHLERLYNDDREIESENIEIFVSTVSE